MLITLKTNDKKFTDELTKSKLPVRTCTFYIKLVNDHIKELEEDSDNMQKILPYLLDRATLSFYPSKLADEYKIKTTELVHHLEKLNSKGFISFEHEELIDLKNLIEKEYTLEFICY